MVERDQGTGRQADEAVARPAGFEPAVGATTPSPKLSTVDAREEERHRRVMASAERVMRQHRNVFAALAK